ncbi:Binding-protein-dependent transport systems inner membrane component precursor, partial [Thermotoga neapolitana LA10]
MSRSLTQKILLYVAVAFILVWCVFPL